MTGYLVDPFRQTMCNHHHALSHKLLYLLAFDHVNIWILWIMKSNIRCAQHLLTEYSMKLASKRAGRHTGKQAHIVCVSIGIKVKNDNVKSHWRYGKSMWIWKQKSSKLTHTQKKNKQKSHAFFYSAYRIDIHLLQLQTDIFISKMAQHMWDMRNGSLDAKIPGTNKFLVVIGKIWNFFLSQHVQWGWG